MGGYDSSATSDISEAIELLDEFTTGEASVFKRDLARTYEDAARIIKSQDEGLASIYRDRALELRASIAEVYGTQTRLEFLAALLASMEAMPSEDYFDRAIRLLEVIVGDVSPRGTEVEAVRKLAKQAYKSAALCGAGG